MSAGGVYLTVRSLEDLRQGLRDAGIPGLRKYLRNPPSKPLTYFSIIYKS